MTDFSFASAASLQLQRGGAKQLADYAARLGAHSVLLITDPGVVAAGLCDAALASFAESDIALSLFTEVEADPPEASIFAAVAEAQSLNADCIIGFGGGSSMDTAKLVALLAQGEESLAEVYGVDQVRGSRLPLILVPTTAGTGSEVTPISIVTTGDNEKKGVVSPVLLPDIALLDAELTLGLPRAITAATGIDAMVHAIEAYTSKRLKNPVSDCLAREALSLLSANIHAACGFGAGVDADADTNADSDIEAREAMLLGACLAGMAFANAPVGGVHALAYPVGARFHVPHGLSNSLMLGPVLRYNLSSAVEAYAELAGLLAGVDANAPSQLRAEALLAYCEALPRDLGLSQTLREVGISEADLPQLARDAMGQQRLLINNPRDITEADALALYQEAL